MSETEVVLDGQEAKKPREIFFCHPCNMQFLTRKSFGAHKRKKAHIAKERLHGPRHRHTSLNEKLGIYVRGYPPTTNETDLVKYFSQFGSVTWVHFGRSFLLLEYSEPSAVNKVMARNGHFLNGKRLMVRYKEGVNVTVMVNDEDINEGIYQSIIAELAPLNDFESEFLCMARKLQPNLNESLQKYNLICHDLYNLLNSRFPDIEVHPFGSTRTGLGFNNSDVDVFLGNVKKRDDEEIARLGNIKKILQKSDRFGNCIVIPGAKIPLVKCVHSSTGIKLDINIKNMLGVLNSKLIQYYLSIDSKVKQVMLILKYWGKCHKIIGQNHLLTNYSLVMMFIFFMQQPPYNFPTVVALQQQEYRQYENTQTIWDGEFVPNYYFECKKLFSTSALELLRQFFEFYTNFPFHDDVICPYLGKSLPRIQFQDPTSLPDVFKRYKDLMSVESNKEILAIKLDSALCLQDPFEHCRNTTSAVSECILEKFVLLCQLGKTICQNNDHVLHKLLTVEPPSSKTSKVTYQGEVLKITLSKSLSSFTKSFCSEDWFEIVNSFLTISLRSFLQMKVVLSSSEDSNARKKIYICTGQVNLWHSRKRTAKQMNLLVANMTVMDREWAITSILTQLIPKNENASDIFGFKITVQGENDDEVSILVEKLNSFKKSHEKSFALFFAANFQHWFEGHMKDISKTKEEAKVD